MIEPLLEAERALTMGLLDQAERLYRGVVAADPRNSIAVVGLARVAIERGDDLEALRLGRWALRIDAENVMALRLVARLEEVLRTRGVEVPEGDEQRPSEPAASTSGGSAGSALEPATSAVPPARPVIPASRRRGIIRRLLRRGR